MSAQVRENFLCKVKAFNQGAFDDFQLKSRRRKFRFSNRPLYQRGELGILQLHCGNIARHDECGQFNASRQARLRTNSPSSFVTLIFSAITMKSAGPTGPRVALFQRSSASTAAMRDLSTVICG